MARADLLLERNRAWAGDLQKQDPHCFERIAGEHKPDYLWIGCSDSRITPHQVVNLGPGELFVHRNIANLIPPHDHNCLAALQYGVQVLKVADILVVGHHGCGGVQAVLKGASCIARNGSSLDHWLSPLVALKKKYDATLAKATCFPVQWDLLCRLNVIEQVLNLSRTAVVQAAWQSKQPLRIHGWIYNLKTGIIEDLGITLSQACQVEHQYQQAIAPFV